MTLADDSHGVEARRGLSAQEAARRLLERGPNELQQQRGGSFLAAFGSIAMQPMVLLLIGGGVIYWMLGEVVDAVLLMACVAATVALTLYQNRKTERTLSRLRELSAPLAHVIRDGVEKAIPSREIVPGDIVLLREGARVPADAVVLDSTSLRIDESLLSGESVPVDKVPGELDAPLVPVTSDEETCAYAGTLVVRGHGVAVVRETGMRTAMGNIGSALSETQETRSALRQEIDRVVRRIALGGGLLCSVLVALYGTIEGDFMHGLLAGITLAMAIR